jgi:hypothetical protein
LAAYSDYFSQRVQRTKRDLLSTAKKAGKRICGYGAPGKGNTLLNYCGIGPDFLDFTVDRNSYKHGRYTRSMRIPIMPVDAIDTARPDYVDPALEPEAGDRGPNESCRRLGRQVHRPYSADRNSRSGVAGIFVWGAGL